MILSYTTSAAEDAAITYALGVENARLAALTPPRGAITAAQYVTNILASVFSSYASQAKAADIATIKATYDSASAAKQAAIVAAAIAAAK